MKTRILAWLVSSLLLSLAVNLPAYAIVVFRDLGPEQTPILIQGLESKIPVFKAYYKTKDLSSFWFEVSETKANPEMDNVYQVQADPEAALKEIETVYRLRFGSKMPTVINEFARINDDILSRGYVLASDGKRLQVSYQKKEQSGPQYEPPANGNAARYIHSMTFEMQLKYLPKGKSIQDVEEYPRTFLRGQIYFGCEKPTQKCSTWNVSIDEAGITWETVPTFRGGISSAGGGN